MSMSSAIAKKAEEKVTALYRARLPVWANYHTLAHTREVVASCLEIGMGMHLGAEDLEAVVLAGWFHDAGYVDGAEGHEERSVVVAEEFLRSAGYPEPRLQDVLGCIRATRLPQRPVTLLEQVMCDSDLAYLGGDAFRVHSDSLRKEWEMRTGKTFSEEEWLSKNIEFVERYEFHTSYAQERYAKLRERNLNALKTRLAELRAEAR